MVNPVLILITQIRRWLSSPGVSSYAVSAETGLSRRTIDYFRDDKFDPKASTLVKLVEHLPDEFLVEANMPTGNRLRKGQSNNLMREGVADEPQCGDAA